MTTIETHAIAAVLDSRIAVLWRQHQRDKSLVYWTQARHDRDTELRALLRLRRTARRLARMTVADDMAAIDRLFPEQADPVTAAKAYADLGYHQAQAVGPR